MKFAKLFEYEDGSQILVKKDTNSKDMPETRIYFTEEGLGVCSIGFDFNDDDKGHAARDHRFDTIDKEKAKQSVDIVKKQFKL